MTGAFRLVLLILVTFLAISCSDDEDTSDDGNTPADTSGDQDRVRDTGPTTDGGDPDAETTGVDSSPDLPADDLVIGEAGGNDAIEDSEPADTSEDDENRTDRNEDEIFIAQNTRVAFQYSGANGGSHYVDDILVSDSSSVLIDEGFEGEELPEGWLLRIRQPFYSWEVHFGPSEAHSGDTSAKVTWYEENQDEWLVSPPIVGDGSYTLTFWNKGFVDFSEQATLHAHFTCNDGADWTEIYVFPGPTETEGMVWYENSVEFECPATE